MMNRMLVLVLTLAPALAAAQEAVPGATPFGPPWAALLGEWTAEGQGAPGTGAGGATFSLDLQGRGMVRRSHSDYPAAEGRPAVHHEDLMVISPAGQPGAAHAVYFDNEGHVIEYGASWSADGATLTFASGRQPGAPGFRLTYRVLAPDRVEVSFDVAPPGTDEFRRYVSGVMRRTGGGAQP
jgi:hypothetical protein